MSSQSLDCTLNFFHYGVSLLQNFKVGKAQQGDSLCPQPGIATGIVAQMAFLEVLTAVYLNRKPERWGVKVEDEIAYDALAQKPCMDNVASAQEKPERLLRFSKVAA